MPLWADAGVEVCECGWFDGVELSERIVDQLIEMRLRHVVVNHSSQVDIIHEDEVAHLWVDGVVTNMHVDELDKAQTIHDAVS